MKLTDRELAIISSEIAYDLSFFQYDLRKASCFAEIEENLANGVKSFEVEDDLTGQNEEALLQCLKIVYNKCIIRSQRDLRIKMQFDLDEENAIINVKAKLIDVADHRENVSYMTRLVVENELWTIDEFRQWIAQDLDTEEEIELALEEALDMFNETDDALRGRYESNFSVAYDF